MSGSEPIDGDAFEPRRVFKVLLLGDPETGKTSLIRRLVNDYFPKTKIESTVGIPFHNKAMTLRGKPILLQLWDSDTTSAALDRPPVSDEDERRAADVVGAALVYDVTQPKTLQGVLKKKEELEAENPLLPVILLANKSEGRNLSMSDTKQLDAMTRENGFQAWFPTSAKTGQNVQMAFSFLAVRMLEHEDVMRQEGGLQSGVEFCACS